jgi:signal transduction histidine kinase
LLDNAIKFSSQDGAIKLYSQNVDSDFCDLVIEDSGLGMDESTRQELLKETVLLSKKKTKIL